MNTNNEENMNNSMKDINNVQNIDSTQEPTMVEIPKNKKNVITIVLVVILLFSVGFFIFDELKSSSSSSCIEDVKFEGAMMMDDVLGLELGNTQYIFDSKFNNDFIMDFYTFEEIKINMCYSNKEVSADFQVGSTTLSKKVKSIEFYDRNNNKKLNSTNTNDLLKELGYHPYGTYQEEVTLVDISDSPMIGISDDESYMVYKTEIEFANGKKVKANYKVTNEQQDKSTQLLKGKKYTISFISEKGIGEPISYTITDFNVILQ